MNTAAAMALYTIAERAAWHVLETYADAVEEYGEGATV